MLLMLYRHVCPKGPQKGRGTIRYTPEISREHLDRVRDHNVPSTNNLSLDTAPLKFPRGMAARQFVAPYTRGAGEGGHREGR